MIQLQEVKLLKEQLRKHLDSLDINYKIRIGRIKYGETIVVQLEFCTIDENGKINDPVVEQFKRYANLFGLNPNQLGQKFTCNGYFYEIIGLAPKSRKYPILVKKLSNGKVYKFAPKDIPKLIMNNVSGEDE